MAKIITITDPVQLLLAQLEEIRDGNSQTRNEIERLRRLLKGGEREEARLGAELSKLLSSYGLERSAHDGDECCHFQDQEIHNNGRKPTTGTGN